MAGPEMLIGALCKAFKLNLDPSQIMLMIEQAKDELPKLIARANMALAIIEQRLGAIEKHQAEMHAEMRELIKLMRESQNTIQ